MSVPEFQCMAEDHRCLLLLVQQVGSEIAPRVYSRLYDRISRITRVHVPDAVPPRSVHVRYRRAYSPANNAWSDFQPHRRLVGLISFGSGHPVEPLMKLHSDVWQQYASTLFDSRLVLFADDDDDVNIEQNGDAHKKVIDDPLGACVVNSTSGNAGTYAVQVLRYKSPDDCDSLEEKLQEYITSLFWILESKRRDRALERQDRQPLLTAPFEKKDMFGLDIDSRTYRKRYQGRQRKHVADLCLMAGLPSEAIAHYQAALEILRAADDWLWLAAANEGLCATYACQASLDEPKVSFQRNLSFSMKRGSSAIKEANLRPGGLVSASGMKSSSFTNGLQTSEPPSVALPADIVDKYREAMTNYRKFKHAGVIEMEACLKACRALTKQQKCLDASNFLQNLIYIELQFSEEERLQRYNAMAVLYSQLGMHRKAAFYRRLAAMQSAADDAQRNCWQRCYHLLLDAFNGYKLSVEPKDVPKGVYCYGWPILQLRLLHELIYSARKMRSPAIATRHLSLLLSRLFVYLSPTERTDVANALSSYARHSTSLVTAQTSLVLNNGRILPPVPLLRLPTVTSFKPQSLPPHLRPTKLRDSDSRQLVNSSPFIYSPQMHSSRARPSAKVDLLWVEGEECCVMLQVANPLQTELSITEMALITEDVPFAPSPVNLSLPAESAATQLKMTGVPTGTGKLQIQGYTAVALGIHSHCRLSDIMTISEVDDVSIRVTPALPCLHVSTPLPPGDAFSSLADSVVASVCVSMLAGQSMECEIRLKNIGKQPVEVIQVFLQSHINADLLSRCMACNEQNVVSQLPLASDAQASLTLYLTAVHQMAPAVARCASPTVSVMTPRQRKVCSMETRHAVLEALVKLQYSGGPGLVDNYCRQCAVAVTLEIEPSIVVTRWQVHPSDSPEHFRLTLDLENATSDDIQIDGALNNPVVIARQKTERISLQLQRCHTTAILQERCRDPDTRVTVCSDANCHVADFADIRWTVISTGVKGQVHLEGLTWTNSDLECLYRSPLDIKVWLQRRPHVAGEAIFLDCGIAVPFSCSVQNNSDEDIYEVQLGVRCYMDSGSSSETDHQEATTTVTIGNQATGCKQLSTGLSFSHESSLLFLHPGRYCLKVYCTANLQVSATSALRLYGSETPADERLTWLYASPVLLCLSEDVT